ncbi:Purine nucleoside phosphorylase 1 [compost metagenome]
MTDKSPLLPSLPVLPEYGIVLGSGIVVLEDLEDRLDIPYSEIPGLPETTVAGHAGVLTVGRVPGGPVVAIARGRFHLYEGHPLESATAIMRLFEQIGIRKIILTNAAGGLRDWVAGDLMLIDDHINLMGVQAAEAAKPNQAVDVYDKAWRDRLVAWAQENASFTLRRGTYVGLLGPSYETPAEITYLQRIGGDAVGMSTVPESAYAASRGLSVLGISCITNIATTAETQATTSHGEVVDVAAKAAKAMDTLLRAALA